VGGFQPSPYSHSNSGDYGADWAAAAGAALQVGGAVASSAISAKGAKDQQEAEQASARRSAKQEAELARLQRKSDEAAEASTRAQAAVSALGTKKLLLAVGSVVLVTGLISATLIIRSRAA